MPAITGFGILDGYRGILVRDDPRRLPSYDAGAPSPAVPAHLYRYLDYAYSTPDPGLDPAWPAMPCALPPRGPGRPGTPAATCTPPSAAAPQRTTAVACGISVNLSRPWHKGHHPGLILLASETKAAQAGYSPPAHVPSTTTDRERRPLLQSRRQDQRLSAHPFNAAAHCRIRSYPHHRTQPRPPSLRPIRDALRETPGATAPGARTRPCRQPESP